MYKTRVINEWNIHVTYIENICERAEEIKIKYIKINRLEIYNEIF